MRSFLMAVSAYIFFSVSLGKTSQVVDKLREIPNFVNIAIVTGEYDIIAKIITDDLAELFEITTEKIHMIDGIVDTLTAVVEKEEFQV